MEATQVFINDSFSCHICIIICKDYANYYTTQFCAFYPISVSAGNYCSTSTSCAFDPNVDITEKKSIVYIMF